MRTEEELQELYKHMTMWDAFKRRHDANVFDVLFKDVDYSLGEEGLRRIVLEVAQFFNSEIPVVYSHCDTLAKMIIKPNGNNKSELFYNWELLTKAGINNKDAFALCIVHEMAHLYLKGRHFLLCRNERWCHELAADYIVGVYSTLNDLATGKYKYVVGQLEGTLTHPHGRHRAEIVEYARDMAFRFPDRGIESMLIGLPAFIYGRSKALNQDLSRCLADMSKPKVEPKSSMPENIEDWPDSNLLKRLVMKYKNPNKE